MKTAKVRSSRSRAAIFAAAVVALEALNSGVSAAPQELDCALGQTDGQTAPQSQPIVVIFDAAANTLQAQAGNQNYTFGNVSISNVAMSGSTDTISIGIDRSSLGLVWQQYAADKITTQYGQCRSGTPAAAGH